MAENSYSNSYCEAWLNDSWTIISVQEAIDIRKQNQDLAVRCLECHGPIILMNEGRDNTTRAHAEHRPKHTGCSIGHYYDGNRRPHPQQIITPPATINSKQKEYRTEKWSREEIEAAVVAYIEMRNKELDRIPFTKKDYYADLADRFGRAEKSYEYRMQNISYVFSTLGRRWITGLKPARNVGTRVASEIEEIINEIEGNSPSHIAEFNTNVATSLNKKDKKKPKGNKNPSKTQSSTTQYRRDPDVVAWVLNEAKGVCESCTKQAPFEKDDGTPFLEVHHLRMLADGGSDTINNAVAICPNCHRELHYGKERLSILKNIYSKVGRLIEE